MDYHFSNSISNWIAENISINLLSTSTENLVCANEPIFECEKNLKGSFFYR